MAGHDSQPTTVRGGLAQVQQQQQQQESSQNVKSFYLQNFPMMSSQLSIVCQIPNS